MATRRIARPRGSTGCNRRKFAVVDDLIALIYRNSPEFTMEPRIGPAKRGIGPFSSVCGDVEIEWVAETAEDELPALKSRDNAAVRAQGVCASRLPRKRCDGACV
jgi:hypothetical protein